MIRKRNVGRSLALLAVLGVSSSLVAVPAGAAERTPAPATHVAWGKCPDDVLAKSDPSVPECGIVKVPLDYAKPASGTIDIMISRLASTTPSKRRGVLMFNPGGPGEPGLEFPSIVANNGLPANVMNTYDLIGMDTRGIGHSTPVSCGFTNEMPYKGNVPPYPADDAAVVDRAKVAKDVAELCAKNDRDGHLRHMSTANMARDLDQIRVALGEEKTSYLGFSHGTALGAAYTSMFPERSDRMVLDSNIGDTYLGHEGMRRFSLGVEDTFPDFAKWAAARDRTYGLGRTPEQVRKTFFELSARLEKKPFQGLDSTTFRFFSFGSLYNQDKYATMAQVWQSLLISDEAAVRNQVAEIAPASTPGLSPSDNTWSVFLSVACNDVAWPKDVNTYRRAVAEDRAHYPMFGAASANIMPCAYWPYAPAEPPVAVNSKGPQNVLIVQNLRDPATPLRGGQLLRAKFKDRARMLSVDGSGHGVYPSTKSPCALNLTTAFLVDGEMPRDTFCGTR